MTADKITLSQALELVERSKLAEVRSRLARDKAKLGLHDSISWEHLEEILAKGLLSSLDMKILDLCLAAWEKCDEIQRFADPKQHPADETNEVALLDHEIVSEHHPSVEISVDGARVQRLEMDLDVSLELQGGVLSIQGGRIKSVVLGKCKCSVSLRCKGIVLIEAETQELEFGKPANLGDGVPIGLASRPASGSQFGESRHS